MQKYSVLVASALALSIHDSSHAQSKPVYIIIECGCNLNAQQTNPKVPVTSEMAVVDVDLSSCSSSSLDASEQKSCHDWQDDVLEEFQSQGFTLEFDDENNATGKCVIT